MLRALSSVDETRITRLAGLTLISKPSLSRLLPALEARRLVRRSAAADDARGASIRLAPAGAALIERVAPHSEARYRAIGAAIGDAAMTQLYELLPRLAERLEAGDGDGDGAEAADRRGPAGKATAARASAEKTSAAKTSAATATAGKATALKTTALRATAATTTAAKTSAAKATVAQTAAPTGRVRTRPRRTPDPKTKHADA